MREKERETAGISSMKRESPFCRPVRTSLTHLPTWGTARPRASVLVMYLNVHARLRMFVRVRVYRDASTDRAVAENIANCACAHLRNYVITLQLVTERVREKEEHEHIEIV